MSEHRVLTVQQVAERLQVNVETVRRLLRRGDLPGWRIGGRAGYRIFESHLEEFLNQRRATTCQDCGLRHDPGDKASCIEGHGDDPHPFVPDPVKPLCRDCDEPEAYHRG